jgi:hypothetical protein
MFPKGKAPQGAFPPVSPRTSCSLTGQYEFYQRGDFTHKFGLDPNWMDYNKKGGIKNEFQFLIGKIQTKPT